MTYGSSPIRSARTRASSSPAGMPTPKAIMKPVMNSAAESRNCMPSWPDRASSHSRTTVSDSGTMKAGLVLRPTISHSAMPAKRLSQNGPCRPSHADKTAFESSRFDLGSGPTTVVMAGLVPAIPLGWAPRCLDNFFIEIAPSGIGLKNESGLPRTRPVFDIFLALKRVVNRGIYLEVNEPVDIVSLRETFNEPVLVFVNPAHKIINDAHVQRSPRTTRKDVHVILSHPQSSPERDGRDKPGHGDVVSLQLVITSPLRWRLSTRCGPPAGHI